MVDVPERILEGRLREIADPPVAVEAFMDQLLAVAEPAFPEQLRLPIIGIPATVIDPPSQEIILSRNKVGVRLRPPREHQPNLLPQLRRHALVAVQTEHPT